MSCGLVIREAAAEQRVCARLHGTAFISVAKLRGHTVRTATVGGILASAWFATAFVEWTQSGGLVIRTAAELRLVTFAFPTRLARGFC